MTTASPPAGALIEVESGRAHSCALDANLQMRCWGGNSLRQLYPPQVYAPLFLH